MRALRFILDHFLLLPLGALAAILWANTAPESYFRAAHALTFPVNQVGLALFLALITQEVLEATMRGGPLHTWRRWSLPVLAAAGGFAASALVYLGWMRLDDEPVFRSAWPAATAIDVVFAYFIVRSIFHRSAAVPFLVIAAVTTTVFGFLVLGLMNPPSLHVAGTPLLLAALGLAMVFRRRQVRAFWPYLVLCGPLAWSGLYLSGVHPALALVPIVPFLPHKPRSLEHLADTPDAPATSPRHFEHVWGYWVQGVLFLFGLVNAGVILGHHGAGTYGIVAAAFVGRPFGMLAATALGLAIGLALPHRLRWRDVVVISLAASTGFTFALFFGTVLFATGPLLAQVRLGAVLTAAGILLAYGMAATLGVGRFETRAGAWRHRKVGAVGASAHGRVH